MRVAIDARELQGQPTGVGRVLAGILEAWSVLPHAREHEFLLCAPAVPTSGRSPSFEYVTRGGWTNPTFWEQFTLPQIVRESRADVLFAPGYTGPVLTPVPMVAAIYDVSFAAHPRWFSGREGLRRRVLTRLTAKRAARVITSSEFSRTEISKHFEIDPGRIDVVYPGVERDLRAPRPAPASREDRILFVGSLFTRRHVPELIDGFAQLARELPGARLDIVGDNRTTPRVDFESLIRSSGMAERIALRSFVSDGELAGLYAGARAFVFPSAYEGFGLTPLEALAAGVPIAVLDTPIAREVYGDAALYIAAPEPGLIRDALRRLLTDDDERARILGAAPDVLRRYSWEACGAAVLNALLRAAR